MKKLFLFAISTALLAAVPVHQAGTEKQDKYVSDGVLVGGRDHGLLTLFNVRHSITPKFERLVFDLGDRTKDGGVERPGFFHVSIQYALKRIIIDLENVSESAVTSEQIATLFKKSNTFSKVSMVSDSLHKNLTIELPLKKKSEVEVFELVTPGKPGRIVMDTRPL
jgi:hypothetical protein